MYSQRVNPPRNNLCPHCGCVMQRQTAISKPRRLSRDHILPVEWGGDNTWGDENAPRNYRWCCQECNNLRGSIGHCVGALACVIAVARTSRQTTLFVAKGWGLQRMATLIQRPQRGRRQRRGGGGSLDPNVDNPARKRSLGW